MSNAKQYLYEKDELMHYASKYYDPVKAHEYYMAHRKLKGRRSTGQLNDEGKKVWAYTKNQISEEKKNAVSEKQDERDAAISECRERAKETRSRITEKLKSLNELLTKRSATRKEILADQQATRLKQVEAKKEAELQRLQNQKENLPDNLSPDMKRHYAAEMKKETAKIIGDAASEANEVKSSTKADVSKVVADAKNEKTQNYTSAKEQREKVAGDLKTAISAIRDAYTATKQALNDQYETTFQEEYDRILSEYQKTQKGTKSKASRKSKASSKTSDGNKKLYKITSTTARHPADINKV